MKVNKNNAKIIGAAICGVAIGGIIGLYLTPHLGKDTRDSILQDGSDMADYLKAKLEKFVQDIHNEYESLVKKAKSDFIHNGVV